MQRLLPVQVMLLTVAVGLSPLAAQTASPVAVSPGSVAGMDSIRDGCPTFSWGAVEGARAYELVVYRLPEEAAPILRHGLPAGASSWTPPLAKCLAPGGRYAWAVRARGDQ